MEAERTAEHVTTPPPTQKRRRSLRLNTTDIEQDLKRPVSPPAKRNCGTLLTPVSPEDISQSSTSSVSPVPQPHQSSPLNPSDEAKHSVSFLEKSHYSTAASPISPATNEETDYTPKDEQIESDDEEISDVDIANSRRQTLKDEILAELKNQQLPEDIFTSLDVNWIDLLIQHSTAAPETIQDIQDFIIQ